ncbi:MAG: hypothetical protein ACR5KV_08990 [Wolbachia sp.]
MLITEVEIFLLLLTGDFKFSALVAGESISLSELLLSLEVVVLSCISAWLLLLLL